MKEEDERKLKELSEKFGSVIKHWLKKNEGNQKNPELYKFFTKANEMLEFRLEPSKTYRVASLEKTLNKFFPCSNEIIIIDEEPEESSSNDKSPNYVLKVPKLPPASIYAKKKSDRNIISVDYKGNNIFKKKEYDPVEEAIKLNNIKQKIYCKNYLHLDEESIKKFEEKSEVKHEAILNGYESENERKEEKIKIRSRSKSMFYEKSPPKDTNNKSGSSKLYLPRLRIQKIPITKSITSMSHELSDMDIE